jgi:hypothetical protein
LASGFDIGVVTVGGGAVSVVGRARVVTVSVVVGGVSGVGVAEACSVSEVVVVGGCVTVDVMFVSVVVVEDESLTSQWSSLPLALPWSTHSFPCSG